MGPKPELTAECMRQRSALGALHKWDFVMEKLEKAITTSADLGYYGTHEYFEGIVPDEAMKKVEDKFVNAGFKFVSTRHGALWRVDVRWD